MKSALQRTESPVECVPILETKNRSKRRVEQVVARILNNHRLKKKLYDSTCEAEDKEHDDWD